jgi:hypothetical protein
MRTFLCFLFFFISFHSIFPQNDPHDIPGEIKNDKTTQHFNIPGTHLFLIPPEGFKTQDAFCGLKKTDKQSIQVFDLPGGNYYTNAATFNKEKFESKGAKVMIYKEVKIAGYPAKYIFMKGDNKSAAYSVVFGDSTFSCMVMGIYPSEDEKTGNQIKSALLSICYDKNRIVDPFEIAGFSLDDTKSKFRFTKYSGNMYIYSSGNENKKPDEDEPFAIVTVIPKDSATDVKKISSLMLGNLERSGMKNKEIKNESEDKMNGYLCYEAEIYGDVQGRKSLIYQLVVTHHKKAVIIQGIAKTNYQWNLDEFKKLSHTLKFK